MKSLKNVLRTGAAVTLSLGLAACGNIFGGTPAGQPAPAAQTTTGAAETGFWQDPKAPGAAAQRSGVAAAGDMDNDWDDNGLDD